MRFPSPNRRTFLGKALGGVAGLLGLSAFAGTAEAGSSSRRKRFARHFGRHFGFSTISRSKLRRYYRHHHHYAPHWGFSTTTISRSKLRRYYRHHPYYVPHYQQGYYGPPPAYYPPPPPPYDPHGRPISRPSRFDPLLMLEF